MIENVLEYEYVLVSYVHIYSWRLWHSRSIKPHQCSSHRNHLHTVCTLIVLPMLQRPAVGTETVSSRLLYCREPINFRKGIRIYRMPLDDKYRIIKLFCEILNEFCKAIISVVSQYRNLDISIISIFYWRCTGSKKPNVLIFLKNFWKFPKIS